jgi:hypothetical protein
MGSQTALPLWLTALSDCGRQSSAFARNSSAVLILEDSRSLLFMSKVSKRLFWLFPQMFLLELGRHN